MDIERVDVGANGEEAGAAEQVLIRNLKMDCHQSKENTRRIIRSKFHFIQ
jgi:hypothetical protein